MDYSELFNHAELLYQRARININMNKYMNIFFFFFFRFVPPASKQAQ